MELTLKFMVPTYVVIDTETAEVTRVVVDDGASMGNNEVLAVYRPDGDMASVEEDTDALAAYERNDVQGLEWPAWEFGW